METTEERRARIGSAYAAAAADVLPLEVDGTQLAVVFYQAPFLYLLGTGGGIDWPVRIVDPPDVDDIPGQLAQMVGHAQRAQR